MSEAEKRSVHTDALETLGSIIDDTAARDAIHLAVEPVQAAHSMYPGQHVGLYGDGSAGTDCPHLGIVDPFLKHHVLEGDWFWLVVYPRQITSLRHVWEHPSFDAPAAPLPTKALGLLKETADIRAISHEYIDDLAANIGLSFQELMDAAENWATDGEYKFMGDKPNYGKYHHQMPTFWNHWSELTGRRVPEENSNFFSCSR